LKIQHYNFKDFLQRYNNDTDFELFKVLEELPILTEGVWIAGGAIRRTIIGDPLTSDFDFFFRDKESLDTYRKLLLEKGAKETKKTDHQETYTITVAEKVRFIQLIKINFYVDVKSVLDSFDFTISQFAYVGTNLICGEYSLWDLSRRRLALHKLTYGVATMRRLIKYSNQGFTACAGVMQSILEAVVNKPETINSEIQYID
jgi:hypothetical protein